MTSSKSMQNIIITSGEPAGIGPDLIAQLYQTDKDLRHIVVAIDPELLAKRAEQIGIDIGEPVILDANNIAANEQGNKPRVLPVPLNAECTPGILNAANTPYLINMLDTAVDGCLAGQFDAMVTGPLQKSVINDGGVPFSGHTEYIADKCDNAFPVMLLACPGLRVALLTTHIPLKDVASAITPDRLRRVIDIVAREMRERFAIEEPAIAVCGLNPHAGEDGHLGKEEQLVMQPVIDSFRQQGLNISDPLPADTAFRKELRNSNDVFIAMYHDQGLPVLKTLGFGEAVNITLGLPIIRTSVDHGTALSIAGTGKADPASLIAAIEMAEEMASRQARLKLQQTSNG